MGMLRVVAAGALVAWSALAASIVPGDARRGEQLFHSEQCVQCHSFKGVGGLTAPDLASHIDRDYTPAVMASLMWNHAPDMWAAMKKRGIVKAELSPESAADLFAWFVSARYFERPGDAARGKLAFTTKHCAECHGIATPDASGAPPVAKWESLAFAAKKLARPQISAQELTDMLVYLQNLPETRHLATNFTFPPSDSGEALFESKGCSGCHTSKLALEGLLRNQTLTDIAADMWNHQPSMKQPPPSLSQEEMRQIVSYIWARQYFRGKGNAERGHKVFAEKNCAACHNDPSSGAPKLAQGKDAYSDITLVAALWDHGPRMFDLMTQKHLAWPRFTAQQMSDLIAYLNSL
jgi:mono/diheme cytochrome c family protein